MFPIYMAEKHLTHLPLEITALFQGFSEWDPKTSRETGSEDGFKTPAPQTSYKLNESTLQAGPMNVHLSNFSGEP